MNWDERAERCYERDQAPNGGQPHNNHAIGNVVWALLWVSFKACYRFSARGLDKVRCCKGKEGVLLVCDHASYVDPVFHYLVIRPSQWPRFMAKSDIMKGFPGWFLGMHGAFPVDRDSADLSAIKRAVRYLKDGEVVALFPEGTRRGKGNVTLRIHAGAALIARMSKVPVIPSTVHNVDKIKRKGERPRFPKVTVEYGDPLHLEDFDWIPKKQRLEAFSWYAMRECYSMRLGVPRDQVDMPALFPEDHDYTELFGAWNPALPAPIDTGKERS
jgi:1-acyl-sn-glycerol-3-phosphate acyltransferase